MSPEQFTVFIMEELKIAGIKIHPGFDMSEVAWYNKIDVDVLRHQISGKFVRGLKNTFECLVIFDSYDCPECGGKLKEIDKYDQMICKGDYLTPPTYRNVWVKKRCEICGEDFKEENEELIKIE
jgi:hypothetical protein